MGIADAMVNFGKIPVRMRQFTRHILYIPTPSTGAGAYALGANIVMKANFAGTAVYIHEMTHTMEWSDAFNASALMGDGNRWTFCYNADKAVPDDYSRTNQRENVAQNSHIVLYNKYVGPASNIDPNVSKIICQTNELTYQGTNGKYGGKLHDAGLTCTARHANSAAVSASGTSRVKRQAFSGILTMPDTIEQQRGKAKALGITFLHDVFRPFLAMEKTICSVH